MSQTRCIPVDSFDSPPRQACRRVPVAPATPARPSRLRISAYYERLLSTHGFDVVGGVGTKKNTAMSFRCTRRGIPDTTFFVKVGCAYKEVLLNNHINRQLTDTRMRLTSEPGDYIYIPRMYYAVQETSEKYMLIFEWVDFEGSGYTAVHNPDTIAWLHSMLLERTRVQQQDMDGTNEYYSNRLGFLLFDFGHAVLLP